LHGAYGLLGLSLDLLLLVVCLVLRFVRGLVLQLLGPFPGLLLETLALALSVGLDRLLVIVGRYGGDVRAVDIDRVVDIFVLVPDFRKVWCTSGYID